MTNLIIKIWNVGHGVAIYAKTPNGKKIFLDCGKTTNLSPALLINTEDYKKTLDYLIISHPHMDHIEDIINVDEKYKIKILRRNISLDRETMTKDNHHATDSERLDKYFSLSDSFKDSVSYDESPSNPVWGNGCTFHTYNSGDTTLSVNDRSVVTFLKYGNECIFYGGDVGKEGWDDLLQNNDFIDNLKKTTILIASHHGNNSGYYEKLFDYFKPKITIFSTDSPDDTVTDKYDYQTKGMDVKNRGEVEYRKVLTTNNDGNIQLVIFADGSEPVIRFNVDNDVI